MNKSFFYLCEQQFLYLSHRHCLLASCGEVFSVRFWQKVKRDKIRKLEYKLEKSKKKLRLR